jgi:tetratricopeptide (TPR) repeat protein
MQLSHEEEEDPISLSKFESMLRTNKVLFFDSEEFQDIIFHYLDSGKAALAKKALKLALEQHPTSTGLRLVQAEMLIYDNKTDQAEKLLNELYAIEPNNDEIYIQRASLFSRKDQHEKAIEQLEIALEFTTDFAGVFNLIGMEYLFLDELEKAKESFIKCLEEDVDDHGSLYNVVYCYEFLDQLHEAVEYLNLFIENNPYNEIAWHQLGRIHYQLKNYDEAFKAFDLSCVIDDEFVGAYMEKAKSLQKLKRYEEAIVAYKTTFELDDPSPFAYLRIGKCNEKLGNKNKALRYYIKATKEDPMMEKAWTSIINLFVKEKKYNKALLYVNKALSLDGENFYYWNRHGFVNYKMGNFDAALAGYKKAVELGDYRLDTWIFWTDLLINSNQYKYALKTLITSIEYFPESYDIEYRLAGLYFTMNEIEKGCYHLHNGLRLKFKKHKVLFQLFASVYEREDVLKIISSYQ